MERQIPPTKPGQPSVEKPLPQTPEELQQMLADAELGGARKGIREILNAFSQNLTAAGGHMELYELGQTASLPGMMKGIKECIDTLQNWRKADKEDRLRLGKNQIGFDTVVILPEESKPQDK